MKIGYARISTTQQSLEHQIAALKKIGCTKIFSDITPQSEKKRPGLKKLIEQVKKGDVVTVTSLDRLGRSGFFILNLIDQLTKKGVNLHILSHWYVRNDIII